jgi:hypothetical protein
MKKHKKDKNKKKFKDKILNHTFIIKFIYNSRLIKMQNNETIQSKLKKGKKKICKNYRKI